MSRYVKKSLTEGEEIIIKAKKSWWFITWPIICFVGAVVALIFAIPPIVDLAETVTSDIPFLATFLSVLFKYILPILLGLILGLSTFIPACKHLITALTLQVVLTNKRLISRVGLFRTRALDIPIDKIDHVEVRASLFGNWFHDYEVEIASVSGTDGVIAGRRKSIRTFCGISNAKKLRESVIETLEQHADVSRRMQAKEIAFALNEH